MELSFWIDLCLHWAESLYKAGYISLNHISPLLRLPLLDEQIIVTKEL